MSAADAYLALCILVLLVAPLMLVRNALVFRFRKSMLEQIHAAYLRDFRTQSAYNPWRYRAYEQVSYNAMMVRFWKRLRPESWYDDTSFLNGAR